MGNVQVSRFIEGSIPVKRSADFCVDHLLAGTDVMALNELRRLCPFVPLLVLLPESSVKPPGDGKERGERLQRESLKPTKAPTLVSLGSQHKSHFFAESEFAFGEVTVNFPEMIARRKGELVRLRAMEFKTLAYFVRHPRRVISRDELLNEVWGYENYPCTRTVDNHVLQLRKKLEKYPGRPAHFRTVHNAGYKFLP